MLDVGFMIEQLGGVAELKRKIESKGHEITYKGIEKWRERKSITGKWLITLQTLASDEGFSLKAERDNQEQH